MKVAMIHGQSHKGSTYHMARMLARKKLFFLGMHLMPKNGDNPSDVAYWKEKGWLEKKRP